VRNAAVNVAPSRLPLASEAAETVGLAGWGGGSSCELPPNGAALPAWDDNSVAATLPLGSTGYENAVDEHRQRLICSIGRWSIGSLPAARLSPVH
jgi:hypothetical protein